MGIISKLNLLLQIAIHDPQEFADRLEAIITSKIEKFSGQSVRYALTTAEGALSALSEALREQLVWEGVEEIEVEVRGQMDMLERVAPFTTRHPGVAYGVTTAFVLKALQVNGKGVLHSIDLSPLEKNTNAYVGYLVPNQLRDRWVLHRGVSTRILPKLLPQLARLDLFIHDSLHTYWNIRRELNMITPYLARPGVVIVDDIQDNLAFSEWVDKVRPTISVEFQEEQ